MTDHIYSSVHHHEVSNGNHYFIEGNIVSNLTQNIQNFFIRSVAFFSVILKSFTDFIKNFFGFFGSLIGFTPSDYFLESDEAQGTKRSNAKQEIAKEQNNIAETPTTNNRKKAKIDNYFLNMAREVKKS